MNDKLWVQDAKKIIKRNLKCGKNKVKSCQIKTYVSMGIKIKANIYFFNQLDWIEGIIYISVFSHSG